MTTTTAIDAFRLGDRTVNRMGYGAMQLAGPGVFGPPKDHDTAIAVLREAVASGVNHIDTSDFYGPHITNQLIRHPGERGRVRAVPQPKLVERRDFGGVVDLHLLRADDRSAPFRIHAAHNRERGRVAVAHAAAVRHLVEPVARSHGPDGYRLEQDVVPGIAARMTARCRRADGHQRLAMASRVIERACEYFIQVVLSAAYFLSASSSPLAVFLDPKVEPDLAGVKRPSMNVWSRIRSVAARSRHSSRDCGMLAMSNQGSPGTPKRGACDGSRARRT